MATTRQTTEADHEPGSSPALFKSIDGFTVEIPTDVYALMGEPAKVELTVSPMKEKAEAAPAVAEKTKAKASK